MNLKQVAAVAGVSVSTVSRVLNGKSYVNEETRKIVTEAIRKTNYQPNALAQSLKMGRSNTICLMIPSIENLMFPKLTRGVEDEARKNGMTVFLCNTDEDAAIEKSYLETMKQRWIDGFIVCSLSSDAPHIRSLRDEGYPLVLVNRFEESDIGKVDTVTSDNFQIGYDATRYLARIGHKRIAIVCGREELLLYRERLRGYRKALADSGLPEREEYLLRESGGSNGFYYQIRELAEQGQLPDAIFCTSDPKAFVVMHALHDMGLRIPEDVAVIGSVPLTPYGTPSTTEVPDAIEPYLEEHDVMLLENHGALAVGSDVITAFYRMESLELWAKITINAVILGGSNDISRENIQKLIDLRGFYRVTGRHPGYKKFDNGLR